MDDSRASMTRTSAVLTLPHKLIVPCAQIAYFLLSLFLSVDFEAKSEKNALFLLSGEIRGLRASDFCGSHMLEKNGVKKILEENANFP